MLKKQNNKQLAMTVAASVLILGLLSACAVTPAPHATPGTGDTAASEIPDDTRLLDPAALAFTSEASGPRLKRASKPGLRDKLPPAAEDTIEDDPELSDGTDLVADDNTPGLDDGNDEPGDLWVRIRDGFALNQPDNKRVKNATTWYTRHPSYVARVTEQAEPYLHYIVNEVEQRGMPAEIALLPVVESAYQPFAYSPGRAAGLWQFIPATGKRFGLKLNWWYDGRRDVVASTQAALDYLQYLHDMFDGDWLLALAAYNSGEGTVQRAIRENKKKGKPTDYWSLRLPRETQEYVPRLLAISAIVARPEEEGVALQPIADQPYLTSVDMDGQLDLSVAAGLADMSVEELQRLNPGFNRWATDPDGPHRLLLPADKAEIFNQGLASLPPEQRVQWVRHRIRNGETLGHIAARYGTTVDVLRRINQIKGNNIRAGKYLMIPVAGHELAGDMLTARASSGATRQYKHKVESGDSLWQLARRYDVSVKQLADWNDIDAKKPLRPGQNLIVKSGTRGDNATALGKAATQRKIVYTVRSGDSLARISQRFNVSVKQLLNWNQLSKNRIIKPGQQLTVFIDVTADSSAG